MTEIKIPFKYQFKEAILTGVKFRTARNKKYGKPGDTFKIFGKTFELTEVRKESLLNIRNFFWRDEGAISPLNFVNIWRVIHPRKGFVPAQVVWLHTWKFYCNCRRNERGHTMVESLNGEWHEPWCEVMKDD